MGSKGTTRTGERATGGVEWFRGESGAFMRQRQHPGKGEREKRKRRTVDERLRSVPLVLSPRRERLQPRRPIVNAGPVRSIEACWRGGKGTTKSCSGIRASAESVGGSESSSGSVSAACVQGNHVPNGLTKQCEQPQSHTSGFVERRRPQTRRSMPGPVSGSPVRPRAGSVPAAAVAEEALRRLPRTSEILRSASASSMSAACPRCRCVTKWGSRDIKRTSCEQPKEASLGCYQLRPAAPLGQQTRG